MELSSRLDELVMSAESSAPAPAVSAASALRRGRRARRWRTAAAAGVAAVLLGSVALGTVYGSGGPAPVGAAAETGSDRSDRSPLAMHVRFGWLPDDVTAVDANWNPELGDRVLAPAGSDRSWLLGSPGPLPWSEPSGQPGQGGSNSARTPAPDVNGRKAYWVSEEGGSALELLFQAPDGRWLSLRGMGSRAPEQEAQLRIAAGVQVGRFVLPVPVSLDPSTPLSDVISVDFRRTVRGADTWQLAMQVKARENATVTISAESGSLPVDPAQPWRRCATGEGMWWCAAPFTADSPSGQVSADDVKAWFGRLVPHSTDERTWSPVLLP
ncbi:hypothetical protein ACFV1L_33325 [Kitasatospora sp. NPDC059646]|uniref:hypothetical protein n=1 Tax=Kitasatospora sp. NPDC059646 TaxID=3346893 RepID=UPI0036B49795